MKWCGGFDGVYAEGLGFLSGVRRGVGVVRVLLVIVGGYGAGEFAGVVGRPHAFTVTGVRVCRVALSLIGFLILAVALVWRGSSKI